jgi:hypothetical protein
MALKGNYNRNALEVSKYSVSSLEVEIENIDPEQTVIPGLAELCRKTGLIVRAVGRGTFERLFAEIETYEEKEGKSIPPFGTKPF